MVVIECPMLIEGVEVIKKCQSINWIKLRKCDEDDRWRKAMLAGFVGCWPETNIPILFTLDKLGQIIYKKHEKDRKNITVSLTITATSHILS